MTPFDLYHNAVRAKEIISVLARYGFGDILQRLPTPPDWISRWVPSAPTENQWKRIRYAIEELGPTFIKIGQILSTRTDVLPPDLIVELQTLTSQVSTLPFEEMEPILNRELGKPYQEVFSDFNKTPVAAGSLGQVYQAKLKENGIKVSVKIQRPNLRRAIEADMEILGWLAKQIHQRIEAMQPYDLFGMVEETSQSILRELDFELEARNSTLFNQTNPYPDEVFAPKTIYKYSSRRTLVSEWVNGHCLDTAKIEDANRLGLAEAGCKSVLHQIIESGFFHADPHAGNILISNDGKICFLDWGMVGQITAKMRFTLAELLSGILQRNPEKIVRAALKMSKNKRRHDIDKLEKSVNLVLLSHGLLEGQFNNLGEAGIEILFCLSSEGVSLSRDYAILAKTLYSIEKTGEKIAPDFQIDAVALPFVKKIMFQQMNPMRMGSTLFSQLTMVISIMRDLPGDFQRLIRRFEEEDVNINLYHKGTEHLKESIQYAANHLSLAVLCAGFVVGSSLIVTTGMKPHLFGYPALGMIGFIISGLLGLWLMLDILWSKFKSKK
jgi:ubiquinone biosynthesis protein